MNGKDRTLYKQLVDERQNRLGWFRTPPASAARLTPEMIELVNRVLAREEQREKEKKPLWQFKRSPRA